MTVTALWGDLLCAPGSRWYDGSRIRHSRRRAKDTPTYLIQEIRTMRQTNAVSPRVEPPTRAGVPSGHGNAVPKMPEHVQVAHSRSSARPWGPDANVRQRRSRPVCRERTPTAIIMTAVALDQNASGVPGEAGKGAADTPNLPAGGAL